MTSSNRLIHEKSPYLLQHAHNPVDWYPWGEEAFRKARTEDKPIFLSVGYSTCHWCHVMEKESFMNSEIAKFLNEHFVSIKVDREERPDIDGIYMQAVMAISGSGGWPMSVFLTTELKPFYGGTYFPPEDGWGRPGFMTVLKTIHHKWVHDRENLERVGNEIVKALEKAVRDKKPPRELHPRILDRGFEELLQQFDPLHGGFGAPPKFPRSHALSFLLRYWERTGNDRALQMVEKTLQAMADGGLYDQLGGGFHRYSTDEQWVVPHFEKMLYDQALLSRTYVEAFQATGKKEYAMTARGIFDYVLSHMRDSRGGFYSAEDADSAPDPSHPHLKTEGAYYLWTEGELDSTLNGEETAIVKYFYGIRSAGNAPHDPHGEFYGKNVLFKARSLAQTAQAFGKSEDEIQEVLESGKRRLLKARQHRLRPHLDDKVLTDWNALMISSLAYGGRALGESRYVEAAKCSCDFLLRTLKHSDGRLFHRWREGEKAVGGFLDDYAFLVVALTDLYEASFETQYLADAINLAHTMHRLFWDNERGGFFFSASDSGREIVQTKWIYDSAVPSGNSMAAYGLVRLGRLVGKEEFERWARQSVEAFSSEIAHFPSAYPQMLMALELLLEPSREVVVAGDPTEEGTRQMLCLLHQGFYPRQVVLLHPADSAAAQQIEKLAPFIAEKIPQNSQPTAYVCQDHTCKNPVTNATQLAALLKK